MYQEHVDITASNPTRALSPASRVEEFLRQEGLLVGLVAVVTGISLARLAREVTQDTWLSLLGGRIIVHSGLHHDSLTYFSKGMPWIDQQWLAHLILYGIYSVGGLVLVCLFGVAFGGAAVAGAMGYARRRGATARSVAWVVAASALPFFVGAGNIRTQILVLPVFVVVLGLLLDDLRRPSGRVFFALPLLLLWANLHGSVIVPGALVVLRAAIGCREAALRLRSLALAIGAVAACAITPYGFDIFAYYRRTLLNPSFHSFVAEWRPLSLGLRTAPIMILGAVSIWLLGRHVRQLGAFRVLAQLLLVAIAFAAVRSAVWLGLGSIMLLTPALDAELKHREFPNRRLNLLIAITGGMFALLAVLAVVSRGTPALASAFPAQAGNVVAREAGSDGKVMADERFGDWLMFKYPRLVGRVGYDASFEQLSARQVLTIIEWKDLISGHWQAATRGAKVIVVSLPNDKNLAQAYRRDRSLRERYVDSRVAVFVRR
jgi:hypothetical protein